MVQVNRVVMQHIVNPPQACTRDYCDVGQFDKYLVISDLGGDIYSDIAECENMCGLLNSIIIDVELRVCISTMKESLD